MDLPSVGWRSAESKAQREDVCSFTTDLMPHDRPRYLMGVGTPLDILEAVHRGVDMFDCIIPTQVAQRGGVFTVAWLPATAPGRLQIFRWNAWTPRAIAQPACGTPAAYLHHLTKTKETLGWQLLGQHNIYFYHRLMRDIRQSILVDRFLEFYREKRAVLHEDDLDNPVFDPGPKLVKPRRLGNYEVHVAPEGFASIRQISSGEIMHARTPPLEEARWLYVEQSRLAERLRLCTQNSAGPLVIWDVGLGAAANAMAAIQCYEAQASIGEPLREMQIVSFENDLDSLRLAILYNRDFLYLRHGGPAGILQKGRWQSKEYPGLSWTLVMGDFLTGIDRARTSTAAAPEIIFYDPFSGNSDDHLWTIDAFDKLRAVCAGQASELFTYSASTAVRGTLLAAGWYVAKGWATGERSETTMALTAEALALRPPPAHNLLGADWLGRWNRSGAKIPAWVRRRMSKRPSRPPS